MAAVCSSVAQSHDAMSPVAMIEARALALAESAAGETEVEGVGDHAVTVWGALTAASPQAPRMNTRNGTPRIGRPQRDGRTPAGYRYDRIAIEALLAAKPRSPIDVAVEPPHMSSRGYRWAV